MRLWCLALLLTSISALFPEQQQVQPGAPTSPLPEPTHVIVDVGERTTALYHRDQCEWVRGLAATKRFTVIEAKKRYFQPHCQCITGRDTVPPCESGSQTATPQAVTPEPVPAPLTKTPAKVPGVNSTPPAGSARPVSVQCAATTKKGTRCSRNAQPGRAYCWQH